jgi:hypothetical protein
MFGSWLNPGDALSGAVIGPGDAFTGTALDPEDAFTGTALDHTINMLAMIFVGVDIFTIYFSTFAWSLKARPSIAP